MPGAQRRAVAAVAVVGDDAHARVGAARARGERAGGVACCRRRRRRSRDASATRSRRRARPRRRPRRRCGSSSWHGSTTVRPRGARRAMAHGVRRRRSASQAGSRFAPLGAMLGLRSLRRASVVLARARGCACGRRWRRCSAGTPRRSRTAAAPARRGRRRPARGHGRARWPPTATRRRGARDGRAALEPSPPGARPRCCSTSRSGRGPTASRSAAACAAPAPTLT